MIDESEDENKFSCVFQDGSKFIMPNKSWQKAWEMKYPNTPPQQLKKKFKHRVEKFWRANKVPTKFPINITGEERKNGPGFTYEPIYSPKRVGPVVIQTRAELAKKVMYTLIRAPLLSIAIKEMTQKKGKKESKVITLSGTVYDGEKKKKKNFFEVFPREEEEKDKQDENAEKEIEKS